MELINHNDGTWSLRKVSELEHLMLSRLPEAADPTDCEAAQHRLYPSPIAPTADVDESDATIATDEWREYIEPDLRSSFRDALKIVADDLGGASKRNVKGATFYQINVPKAHADHWCNALNQARLVIHHRHRLPTEDGEMDDDPDAEKWMAMLQSEIYSIIMEFLVTRVLWLK